METPAVIPLSLATLADGAAEELFREALGRVLVNIRDPNTDHRVKRGITLTFVVSVEEDRKLGKIEVRVATKLAGVRGVMVPIYVGLNEGELTAVEAPRQEEMFTTPHGRPRPVAAAEGVSAS